DQTLGVRSAAILNLDIGHGALVFRRIGPDPTIGLSDFMGNAGASNQPRRSISVSLATLSHLPMRHGTTRPPGRSALTSAFEGKSGPIMLTSSSSLYDPSTTLGANFAVLHNLVVCRHP